MMKKQSGITLIALVITIIVLLILAGVSISAITGENGIVEKARQAALKTESAEKEEQDSLGTLEEYINSSISSDSTAKTLVQAFKDGELKVGDYVTYIPSNLSATVTLNEFDTGVECEQTYSVDQNTTWRVLGLNENGTELLLTTGSPIKKDGTDPYLHLQGAESYYNCVDTLNKICELYHNVDLASETRSMTIEDVNDILGVVKEGNILYKSSDATKTNIDLAGILGESYTYKVGDYAPENYLKEKYPENQYVQELKAREEGDSVSVTAYSYSYLNENIVASNSKIYDVLFEGTTDAEGNAKEYWLASRGISVHSSICYFGPSAIIKGEVSTGGGIFNTSGHVGCYGLAVRPVVSLKSSITIDKIKKTTGSEDVWNTSAGLISGEYVDKGQITE